MSTKIKNSFDEIMKDISESKALKIAIYCVGILVVACLIFQAGVIVGFHKASFGRDWDTNYSKNFGSRGTTGMPENFPNAHGAFGTIVKVQLPTMIVADKDNTEKVILITDQTVIRKMRENATQADLVPDAFVVVIGSPNTDGQIQAQLIRILPAPPPDPTASSLPSSPASTTTVTSPTN
jgi:hypothetical protein